MRFKSLLGRRTPARLTLGAWMGLHAGTSRNCGNRSCGPFRRQSTAARRSLRMRDIAGQRMHDSREHLLRIDINFYELGDVAARYRRDSSEDSVRSLAVSAEVAHGAGAG